MKINNNANLTKKTVFIYKNIKSTSSYQTDPTADPSTVTVRTILSTLEIVFQK